MVVSWRHFVVAALLFFVGAIGFVCNKPLGARVATAGMCRFLSGFA